MGAYLSYPISKGYRLTQLTRVTTMGPRVSTVAEHKRHSRSTSETRPRRRRGLRRRLNLPTRADSDAVSWF